MEQRNVAGVYGAVAPWNGIGAKRFHSVHSGKTVSQFCAFYSVGAPCRKGDARGVEVMPGVTIKICICDEHFNQLQSYVAQIKNSFEALNAKVEHYQKHVRFLEDKFIRTDAA